jgi:hypothetical protein
MQLEVRVVTEQTVSLVARVEQHRLAVLAVLGVFQVPVAQVMQEDLWEQMEPLLLLVEESLKVIRMPRGMLFPQVALLVRQEMLVPVVQAIVEQLRSVPQVERWVPRVRVVRHMQEDSWESMERRELF